MSSTTSTGLPLPCHPIISIPQIRQAHGKDPDEIAHWRWR